MKKILLCTAIFSVISLLHGAEAKPKWEQVRQSLRKDHPRIFLNRDQLEQFRQRANGPCLATLQKFRTSVDALPDIPVFELKTDAAEFDGKVVTFNRMLNDQNATMYAFKNYGGYEAMHCAILFRATGERKYLEKGYRYLMHLVEFCRIADRSRILPEWFNSGRMCGLTAYDWLYQDLTPEQRKAFIVPMLQHLEHMRNPGYGRNSGGVSTGNYGEMGLWWYAGLAAYGDGYADELAEKFLKDGWRHNFSVMEYRDRVSGGKGLLTSICTGYSFGYYPWATNLFLLSMQSACGIDGTKYWVQPRDYANYYSWMIIPNSCFNGGIGDFGWGDAFHVNNQLWSNDMYTHLAFVIHFYGDSQQARALMKLQPESLQNIDNGKQHPWSEFVLTNYDPEKKFVGDPYEILNQKTAEYFPSFGLLNMRSGVGENDTYASIKAGAKESGHQHYDELSFIIFKKGYQALDTGNRGLTEHHLVYYPQTIAHNSLLIRMPEEPLASHWYSAAAPKIDHTKTFNDGGQNRRTAGKNRGVDIGPWHAATVGDATRCYSGEKCKEAVRHFVYIKPDYFVVYDRLTSVKPDQEKVFLLHTQLKPAENQGVWKGRGGDGALFLKTVLPADAKTEVIGGAGKEFWVQGKNYPVAENILRHVAKRGGMDNTWLGSWRLEIKPGTPAAQTRFLTVMQAADGAEKQMVPVENISDQELDGVRFTTKDGMIVTARFRKNGKVQGFLKLEKDGKVLLDKALNPEVPVMHPQPMSGKAAALDPGMATQARIDLFLDGENVKLQEEDLGSAQRVAAEGWMQGENRAGILAIFNFVSKDWQRHVVTVKAQGNGKGIFCLKGPDVRKDGKKQPYYVDFQKLTVNGKVLFDGTKEPLTVWHNDAKKIPMPIKDGELLEIEIICRPTPFKQQ